MASRIRQSTGIVALLVLGSGCTLYQPRPVTFNVRDGDTGEPIEGASVKATYMTMLDFGVLFASVGPREGKTDRDGKLTLIVDAHTSRLHLQVSADGFPNGGALRDGTWRRLVPGPWYSWKDEYFVELYRGAQPNVDVTFKDGFRGAVLVKFLTATSPPIPPTQRKFAFTASERGLVVVSESAPFEHSTSYESIHARYSSGTSFPTFPNPHGPEPDAVALRFVTRELEGKDDLWLYVLGTAAEADAVYKSVWPDDNHFDKTAWKRVVDHCTSGSP